MHILLIDGQGGRMGKELSEAILARFPDQILTAVGTNSTATETMHKAGVKRTATGENAVIVGCRTADIIVGPLGIVIADSMLGEITPSMALAVAQSNAIKVLIPSNRCNHLVAGVSELPISAMLDDAIKKIANLIETA